MREIHHPWKNQKGKKQNLRIVKFAPGLGVTSLSLRRYRFGIFSICFGQIVKILRYCMQIFLSVRFYLNIEMVIIFSNILAETSEKTKKFAKFWKLWKIFMSTIFPTKSLEIFSCVMGCSSTRSPFRRLPWQVMSLVSNFLPLTPSTYVLGILAPSFAGVTAINILQ